MHTRNFLLLALLPLALVGLAFLAACGSGSGAAKSQASTPIFTSTPVTAAAQDVGYTYQLAATDPAGGSVTFALTTSPTGATLSGNTISWTPAAMQSRVSNSFAVTATTMSGGTASQSWTVTPLGTITVNWVNTYWEATGQVQVPALPSAAANLSVIVANPDGSVTVQKSSATSPGVFSIPNVPAGYYWLQIGTGEAFWTSAGAFDAGQNIAGAPLPTSNGAPQTQLEFNLSGLASVPELTLVDIVPPIAQQQLGFFLIDSPNSTTSEATITYPAGIDWSQINTIFFMQYLPASLGSLNNLVLGPSLTATGLTLVNGTTNTITETLQPSPQAAVNLSVPGASQWAPLFSNAAPSTPTPFASALSITAQPYVTGLLASGADSFSNVGIGIETLGVPTLTLAGTAESGLGLGTATCDPIGFPEQNTTPAQSAIVSDENFGAWQYGDSFPSAWTRTLSLCQEYLAAIPIPNSSATANFAVVDGAIVAPSNSPIAPVVLPVQNPTINGGSLFTSSSATSSIVSLSWTAPTGTAPFGYTVRSYVQTMEEGIPTYGPTGAAFSTAQTSISLPPLAGGNTYVFAITADADGSANMQTSPFRSSLPVGYATVVSAPVTINSGAMMPEIHGDRRVITRLSQPQPRSATH